MMLGVKSETNANGVTEELPAMGTMTLHRLRESRYTTKGTY